MSFNQSFFDITGRWVPNLNLTGTVGPLFRTREDALAYSSPSSIFQQNKALQEQVDKFDPNVSVSNPEGVQNVALQGLYGLTKDKDIYNQNLDIANKFQGLFNQYSASAAPSIKDYSGDIAKLANSPELLRMASGGLSQDELDAINAQLGAVDTGKSSAINEIENRARAEATSRGLFSSRGAIAKEAADIGQLEQGYAGQRAGILGQKAALSRQGRQVGTEMISSLLGQAGQLGQQYATTTQGLEQSRAGLLGQMLSGRGQALAGASSQNQYLANLYQSLFGNVLQRTQTEYSRPQPQKFLGIF